MEYRFLTFEQAAVFAARKQSEGHLAAILDDHVAHLWGPLATGGVRVSVSETTGEEAMDLPSAGFIERFLRFIADLVGLAGVVVLVLGLVHFIFAAPAVFILWMLVMALVWLVLLALAGALAAGLAALFAPWRFEVEEKPMGISLLIFFITVLLLAGLI